MAMAPAWSIARRSLMKSARRDGHGRTGAYAGPRAIAEFKAWLADFVASINAK